MDVQFTWSGGVLMCMLLHKRTSAVCAGPVSDSDSVAMTYYLKSMHGFVIVAPRLAFNFS